MAHFVCFNNAAIYVTLVILVFDCFILIATIKSRIQPHDLKKEFADEAKTVTAKLQKSFKQYLNSDELKNLHSFSNTRKKQEGTLLTCFFHSKIRSAIS